MITCTFDFIVFPILYAGVQVIYNGNVSQQWHPITLEGAGLYHIAMGAVLGVAAWTRGHEKMLIGTSRYDRDESSLSEEEYQEDMHSGRTDNRYPELK